MNRFFCVVLSLAVVLGGIVGCDTVKHSNPLSAQAVEITKGTMTITSVPDTANVKVGGQLIGTTPIVHEVLAGTYTVVVGKVGYYDSTLTVSVVAGENTSVHVKLVPEPAPVPVLLIDPISLNFGTTDVGPKTISVSNTGTGTLNWSATESASWLSITPASGNTNSGTVNVTVNRAGLTPNNYNTTIAFTSNGGNASVTVTMTVPEPEPTCITLLSNTRGIGAGEGTASGNMLVQLAAWELSGGSMAGATPYITVSCSDNQKWYLLVYRSAGGESQRIEFTGPGEHQICGPLPNNFLGLYIGVETGNVRAHKVAVCGCAITPAARYVELPVPPIHHQEQPLN